MYQPSLALTKEKGGIIELTKSGLKGISISDTLPVYMMA